MLIITSAVPVETTLVTFDNEMQQSVKKEEEYKKEEKKAVLPVNDVSEYTEGTY